MPISLSQLKLDESSYSFAGSYIMALDCGTGSVRASIVDEYGCIVAESRRKLKSYYPHDGWVEQDPTEMLASQIAVMTEVQFKTGIHSDRISAIGISNQRETIVVWDRDSGQPIYNAIGWQCHRTVSEVEKLRETGVADTVRAKTGLILDPYFSASKIAWILDNVDGARTAADAGELMCGTVDTWLVYNLTGGEVFATDYTNASRTMLFNIHTLTWDNELLDLFSIPANMLPEVRWSSDDFGHVSSEVMTHEPPIAGVVGDQQASFFGHCCFHTGQTKNTYGTGCFMLMNTGDTVVNSSCGLVSTIGIAEGGSVSYALEGSIFYSGSTLRWMRDNLGIISNVEDAARIAQSVPDTGGCYMVPAFSGMGSPYWDPSARGLICGLTMGTTSATLVRAACESMAYQSYDVLKAMERDSGIDLTKLSVDGGASRNEFAMQFQADLLGIPVIQSEASETTMIGAAYLAGLAVGYWDGREELEQNLASAKRFERSLDESVVECALAGWHDAVDRARSKVRI